MQMEYIYNSGVLVETENRQFLFDYYRGSVTLNPDKPCLFVATHSHPDHFDPQIFEMGRPGDSYLLSAEVPSYRAPRGHALRRLNPGEQGTLDGASWRTFGSTDEGIAILIETEGRRIFHSGDLHLWIWEDNSPEYDQWMRSAFQSELSQIANCRPIDLAFFPVDGRLGDRYFPGVEAFINQIRPRHFFPIHFQRQWSILDRFREDAARLDAVRSGETRLIIPTRWNEQLTID